MLNLQNLDSAKQKLKNYNPLTFDNIGNSFRYFLNKISVSDFRHIHNLELEFNHPVTIISGTNKIGKTSILLLIACSHEQFQKYDSTKPDTVLRNHKWRDVFNFTSHENANRDYSYKLYWRVGNQNRNGEGKRARTSQSWTGLGKSSRDTTRINAKIRDRIVRIIDLDRLLPARNFSNSLRRKTGVFEIRLDQEIEQAFNYVFENSAPVEIYKIGSHINKMTYLIKSQSTVDFEAYSSFNAASGEESLINILVDIFDTPHNSLIMIDELEAGIHPNVQRRLADVIQYISWHHKKQFIITTHSPTLLSTFPQKSRKFIDRKSNGDFEIISSISVNAAFSKMDSQSYPLVQLYCEDIEAEFIIKNILIKINQTKKNFDKLVNIIISGPIDQVKSDYLRHKKNFEYMRIKTGYCCVFDGDHINHDDYSLYHQNPNEFTFFLYPYIAPEKFLVQAYLKVNPHNQLSTALNFSDHHILFQQMVTFGLAADKNQARQICWNEFINSPEYITFESEFTTFIQNTVSHFSQIND